MRSIYVGRVLEDSARPHRLEAGVMEKKKNERREQREGGRGDEMGEKNG